MVGAVVLLVGLFVLLTYNRLVRLRLACDNSWAQIEVALKLRHDLVPNLVAAVSGYAGHERATFERTAESRGAAMSRRRRRARPPRGRSRERSRSASAT